MKKDDKAIFHNTQLLLEHYRDVVWSLEVSVFQTNVNFQAEFGNTIEEFLELSYEAGLDLPASDVAARIRSINKSRNMLRIIDSAVALLREKYRNGEECYWVLYYTYLFIFARNGGVDEIVESCLKCSRIFRGVRIIVEKTSIRRMGDLLWGSDELRDPALELLYAERLISGR